MSRHSRSNTYQTEYSVAFQWKKKENSTKKKYSNVSPKTERSQIIFQKKLEHNYRHRLKQIIIDQLEKMEAEYEQDAFSQRRCVSPNTSIKSERPHLRLSLKKDWPRIRKEEEEECINELRRSRSMALEFKKKNESTTLWWWTKEDSIWSSDTDTPPLVLQSKPPVSPIKDTKYRNKSPPYRRNSFIPSKDFVTDCSSSTRSSLSVQMAQATGYQSTTEDFSSFNQDNDVPLSKEGYAHPGRRYTSQENLCSRSLTIPRINLQVLDKTSVEEPCLIFFQEPYQKEDFVKDSTSSESIVDPAPQFDTYRLD